MHYHTTMDMAVVEFIREDQSSPYQRRFGGIGGYKTDWELGYRIYLAKDGDTLIVLFGGGTKRGQQADINRANALHEGYKTRKRRGTAQQRRDDDD
jgi:putative addiction module killer protein